MPNMLRRLFPRQRVRQSGFHQRPAVPETARPASPESVAAAPPPVEPASPVDLGEGAWFEAKRDRHPTVGLARDCYRDGAQRANVDPLFRPMLEESAVVSAIESDEVPIPAGEDREGYYAENHLNYWLSGLFDLRKLQEQLPEAEFGSVLDFGGATGRLSRHIVQSEPAARITIADLSLNHVLWCGEYLGPRVRGVKVGQHAHFPLADRSISLCAGLSVFTHIDRYESSWLAEVERVLAPGGHALLTIHSEHTWNLVPQRPALAVVENDPAFIAAYRPGQPMPAERLIFDFKPGTIYHCCNTFVHTDYVRRVWSKWLDILAIHPLSHGHQTAVVLRKT